MVVSQYTPRTTVATVAFGRLFGQRGAFSPWKSMTSPSRLFLASRIALVATAMSFALRGDIMDPLRLQFALTNEQLGWVAGCAFWGFTLAMMLGGPLCDVIGMGRILAVAFVGHLAGILLTIFASGFWSLFAGTLAIGIANGAVEAACNPLVATLYPDEKTKMLNRFHVWFPGGIVIGGLAAYALTVAGAGWQLKMATMFVPLAIYGALFLGARFPKTERVSSGVSTGAMFAACLRPLFLLIAGCMVLTACTELAPNQWIPSILTASAGVSGILVLVWINGLMALGRQFAGPIVHRLSPTGMLLFSAVFSALGLYLLSVASGWATFGAATIFAVGVCYFWPTMLGFTAERVPRSGALGLAIVGGAGMLGVNFVLPVMGHVYDVSGGAAALRLVGFLPVALMLIFGTLFFLDRARGGYRAEKL
jgi:MFS family permease